MEIERNRQFNRGLLAIFSELKDDMSVELVTELGMALSAHTTELYGEAHLCVRHAEKLRSDDMIISQSIKENMKKYSSVENGLEKFKDHIASVRTDIHYDDGIYPHWFEFLREIKRKQASAATPIVGEKIQCQRCSALFAPANPDEKSHHPRCVRCDRTVGARHTKLCSTENIPKMVLYELGNVIYQPPAQAEKEARAIVEEAELSQSLTKTIYDILVISS